MKPVRRIEKRHLCPDCTMCKNCAERRCELCRGWRVCGGDTPDGLEEWTMTEEEFEDGSWRVSASGPEGTRVEGVAPTREEALDECVMAAVRAARERET